jgi:hypothetical protein
MRKKQLGRRFGAATVTGVVLLCITFWGFTGCKDEPVLSGENKITAFKIGDTLGAIKEEAQEIAIIVPVNMNLAALEPVITVSANASVSPASGEAVNVSHPISYTVTAENGVTRTYKVTVTKEEVPATLDSIVIRSLPEQTIYEIGEAFDPWGLVIAGIYSDGSEKEEQGYTLNPPQISTNGAAVIPVTVSVGEKTAIFTVTVRDVRLEYIEAIALIPEKPYGEALNPETDIAVTGYYSDWSSQIEEIPAEAVTGYYPEKPGRQTVLVTLNGKTATFTITVRDAVQLDYIEVTPLITKKAYGEALDPATDIVVTGHYSDRSTHIEEIPAEAVTGYDPEKPGNQTVLVTFNGKTTTFEVTVESKPEERAVSVTITLPNDPSQEPGLFGIPEGGIKLSTSQNELPDSIIISAGGKDNSGYNNAVYTDVQWYIDGSSYNSTNNIITIYAFQYTLKIPHYITFVGKRDNVEYSRTIEFTVEK